MLKSARRTTSILLFLGGCSSPEEPHVFGAVEAVLGDGQAGAVGQGFALPFVVRVTDRSGNALGGAEVSFDVTSGSGILNGVWERCIHSPRLGDPSPISIQTNADGYAWVSMVPASFGSITVEAQVGPISPVIFTADAPDAGATMKIANPYDQEVIAAPQNGQDFEIRVEDGSGNGAPGVPVTWEITSGSGRIDALYPGCPGEPTSTTEMVTRTTTVLDGLAGGSGYSAVTFGPTTFGVTTVTASAVGVSSPATFTVDATLLLITLEEGFFGETHFLGPDYTSDASVPIGATVEWEIHRDSARISSTSGPEGASFDSGPLSSGERFQFVPDVAGTWQYVDEVTGVEGTLTAS